MLRVAAYDTIGKTAANITKYSFWERLNQEFLFMGALPANDIEEYILKKEIDVVLAVVDHGSFVDVDFIRKILLNYPDVYVSIISGSEKYTEVRRAFLMGAFDYLIYDKLESRLKNMLIRIPHSKRDRYFSDKIFDKLYNLAKHIFDAGDNVRDLVCDIVDTIYQDWNYDSIACQQVIERLKAESYKIFVQKKPWLEKFIYRGDYIRDIGFELKERSEIEQELCRYYSEVNILFKKYNVIDVNKTIYTIGKSIIRQVDEKITLDTVSEDVFLNKTYISHIFKEQTGISFNEFVLDVKIDRAKTLLHYPEMCISDIAELLCFCNSGYFSLLFKRHTGISPTEYRLSLRRR